MSGGLRVDAPEQARRAAEEQDATPGRNRGGVFGVEVDEDRRGQGWGRALMTYAEERALSQGAGERSVTMSRRLAP